jgi:hypothetical protein
MLATKQSESKTSEAMAKPAEARLASKDALSSNPVWQALALGRLGVQTKLAVSQSDDPCEREADDFANQMTGLTTGESSQSSLSVFGPAPKGPQLREEPNRTVDSSRAAPSIVHEELNSPGHPLDSATRSQMENRLGGDFGQVRVHTDSRAAASASAVDALAYTHGNHIVFGAGQYSPNHADGSRLLAHELVHVRQQRPALTNPVSVDYAAASGLNGRQLNRPTGYVQRQQRTHRPAPQPSPDPRIPAIEGRLATQETRVAALQRRLAATQLDLLWSNNFGQRLGSYEQAIYRISNGINTAATGFQQAQSVQAQTDAMRAQAWGLLIAVGTAALFEPLAAAGLGALGSRFAQVNAQIERIGIDTIVERVENPTVALIGGYATNIRGVTVARESQSRGQTPAVQPAGTPGSQPTSDAMSFLTSNLETLARFRTEMHGAFSRRATALAALSDEQILRVDVTAAASQYQTLLNGLNQVGAGVESLRTVQAIARIYEWYMWAAWIRGQANTSQAILQSQANAARARMGQPPIPVPRSQVGLEIGTDIESRLSAIGVARAAHVTLTGHWYSSNSPDNWMALLINWADTYRESITL